MHCFFLLLLERNSDPGNCSTVDRYSGPFLYFGSNPRFTFKKNALVIVVFWITTRGVKSVYKLSIYNLTLYSHIYRNGLLSASSVS